MSAPPQQQPVRAEGGSAPPQRTTRQVDVRAIENLQRAARDGEKACTEALHVVLDVQLSAQRGDDSDNAVRNFAADCLTEALAGVREAHHEFETIGTLATEAMEATGPRRTYHYSRRYLQVGLRRRTKEIRDALRRIVDGQGDAHAEAEAALTAVWKLRLLADVVMLAPGKGTP